jgi:release factor glutamine methyltransferase
MAFLPRESREHEPRRAVEGGSDGLRLHRRPESEAHAWGRPGGHVVVEVGARQLGTPSGLFSAAGWTTQAVRRPGLEATALIATRGSSRVPHRLDP